MFVPNNSSSVNQNSWFQPPEFIYEMGENLKGVADRIEQYVAESLILQIAIGSALGLLAMSLIRC